jgi:AraC-like DNA-binding protein
MAVTHHLPAPPLDAYITSLWHREGVAPYPRLTVLPRPTLHLTINLGDAYQVYDRSGTEGSGPSVICGASWASGVRETPYILVWPHDLRILTVSFKPGGAAPFLRLPLAELRNQIVSLDAIWGGAAVEVRERLGAQPTPQARLTLLERLLLARLTRLDAARHSCDPRRDPWLATVQQAVAAIARKHGKLSIDGLSQQLGLSHCHLITQFQRLVGTTPKTLARLYRLQHVLDQLDPAPAQPLICAQIAHQAGYFDEAHFNRDFHAFTGHTPSEGLRLLRREHVAHTALARCCEFLPAG